MKDKQAKETTADHWFSNRDGKVIIILTWILMTHWALFHRQRPGSGSPSRRWDEPEASVSTANRVGVEPKSWFGTGTIKILGSHSEP